MNREAENGRSKIKVLLVDDSQIALVLIKKMLSTAPDIEVVGTAKNGREALELIPNVDPTIVCTDLHMPVMDGLELTREIMDKCPKPILVISASVSEGNTNVFQLMDAGAVDVFPKPRGGLETEYILQSNDLINKLRIIAGVHVFRRARKDATAPVCTIPAEMRLPAKQAHLRMVAIGASTGGPQAFQYILSRFPVNFPIPVICVQHIGDGFMEGFVEWLNAVCAVKIEIAQEGAAPLPGVVYFPRGGAHLLIDAGGRFKYSLGAPCNGHRPSISATFTSVAEYCGNGVIGVLLTGMGNDGAEGLKEIADRGGLTIAQDEKTCVVFGMPKCAVELGAARNVLPLEGIAPMIMSRVSMNGVNIQ